MNFHHRYFENDSERHWIFRYILIVLTVSLLLFVAGCSLANRSETGTSTGDSNGSIYDNDPDGSANPKDPSSGGSTDPNEPSPPDNGSTEPNETFSAANDTGITDTSNPDSETGITIADELRKQLLKMSLEEKIGQMMFPAFRTDTSGNPLIQINEQTKSAIQKFRPGGIILFSENLATVPQTIAFIMEMQILIDIPLLIGIDEEGGVVSRFAVSKGLGAVAMPPAGTIGQTKDVKWAYKAAAATAEQLKTLGINVDFAPVADIHTNPNNPVIGTRAYSNDPQITGNMVQSAIQGFSDNGIVPVIKHFPGHGDTSTDSHDGLAVVPHDWTRMDSVELVPFQQAIDAGVSMVMTAHVHTPGISDIDVPATLNHDILTKLLRTRLGFKGVIITDAMEMGAITNEFGNDESIVMAVSAGADMLLVPLSLESACNALVQAVKDGKIKESRIDESVQRILMLKKEYQIMETVQAMMLKSYRPDMMPNTEAYKKLVQNIADAAK